MGACCCCLMPPDRRVCLCAWVYTMAGTRGGGWRRAARHVCFGYIDDGRGPNARHACRLSDQ